MVRSEMLKPYPARPVGARLLAAAAALTLPALLLGALMSVGSAEAEPAVEHPDRAAPAAALETPPGAPQKVEATRPAPPANSPPVAKKPRKHRLLPVPDFGGY
ncbi:MAG: hypothetical protein U1A78_39250 [Polyangia bacterium]